MSLRYGDVYHSADSGPGQARHVFLGGNGLPARWAGRASFTILETGFGIGVNFLATWDAWRRDAARPRRLHYVAIEKHPFLRDDLAQMLGGYPEFVALARELVDRWPAPLPGTHRRVLEGGGISLTVVFDDVESALKRLDARADAIYLDGFAPSRNPEMWSAPGAARRRAPRAAGGDLRDVVDGARRPRRTRRRRLRGGAAAGVRAQARDARWPARAARCGSAAAGRGRPRGRAACDRRRRRPGGHRRRVQPRLARLAHHDRRRRSRARQRRIVAARRELSSARRARRQPPRTTLARRVPARTRRVARARAARPCDRMGPMRRAAARAPARWRRRAPRGDRRARLPGVVRRARGCRQRQRPGGPARRSPRRLVSGRGMGAGAVGRACPARRRDGHAGFGVPGLAAGRRAREDAGRMARVGRGRRDDCRGERRRAGERRRHRPPLPDRHVDPLGPRPGELPACHGFRRAAGGRDRARLRASRDRRNRRRRQLVRRRVDRCRADRRIARGQPRPSRGARPGEPHRRRCVRARRWRRFPGRGRGPPPARGSAAGSGGACAGLQVGSRCGKASTRSARSRPADSCGRRLPATSSPRASTASRCRSRPTSPRRSTPRASSCAPGVAGR